jgi:hypothetical protein
MCRRKHLVVIAIIFGLGLPEFHHVGSEIIVDGLCGTAACT